MHRLIATNVEAKAKRTRDKNIRVPSTHTQCIRILCGNCMFVCHWNRIGFAWIAVQSAMCDCALWRRTAKCSKLCSDACTGSERTLCVNIVWWEPKYDSDTHSHFVFEASHGICLHKMHFISFCFVFIQVWMALVVSWYGATGAHCHAHSAWLFVSLARFSAVMLWVPRLISLQVLLYWSFIAIINGHNNMYTLPAHFHLRILNLVRS